MNCSLQYLTQVTHCCDLGRLPSTSIAPITFTISLSSSSSFNSRAMLIGPNDTPYSCFDQAEMRETTFLPGTSSNRLLPSFHSRPIRLRAFRLALGSPSALSRLKMEAAV